MTRLNSGILKLSSCKNLESFWNDTRPEPISWELGIENSVFNFCVGVWAGWSKDIYQKMRTKIPNLLIPILWAPFDAENRFYGNWNCVRIKLYVWSAHFEYESTQLILNMKVLWIQFLIILNRYSLQGYHFYAEFRRLSL